MVIRIGIVIRRKILNDYYELELTKFMKRYFNTKEGAERELERRRKACYKRIEKKGWTIVADNSCVYQDYIWDNEEKEFDDTVIGKMMLAAGGVSSGKGNKIYEATQTKTLKWFVMLRVWTDEMIKDLQNYKGIDDDISETESKMVDELSKIINDYSTFHLFKDR
jgi:hypothetical protein